MLEEGVGFLVFVAKKIPFLYELFLKYIRYRKLKNYLQHISYCPFLLGKHLFEKGIRIFPQKVLEEDLSKIREVSLRLLLEDQLQSGFWAKTYLWRLKSDKQHLPIAGTLTGTFFILDSLLCGEQNKIAYIPKIHELKGTINQITDPKGEFIKFERITSHGREKQFENLRHTSAGFLLRLLIYGRHEVINNIDKHIFNNLLKRESEEVNLLDMGFFVRSIIGYIYINTRTYGQWFKKLDEIFDAFYNHISKIEKIEDVFLSPKVRQLTVSREVIQWTTIWCILPLLDIYYKIQAKHIKDFLDRLTYLVVESPISKENPIYSLSMRAVTVLFLVGKTDESENHRLKEIFKKIIQNISQRNIKNESLVFNPQEPEYLLGYLNFGSIILLLNAMDNIKIEQISDIKVGKTKITEEYEKMLLQATVVS